MLSAMRDYLMLCPTLSGRRIGVDYLESVPHSLSLSGGGGSVYRRYLDGGRLMKYDFLLSIRVPSDREVGESLDINEFCTDTVRSLNLMGQARALPHLDCGTAVGLEAATKGKSLSPRESGARKEIEISVYVCEGAPTDSGY